MEGIDVLSFTPESHSSFTSRSVSGHGGTVARPARAKGKCVCVCVW